MAVGFLLAALLGPARADDASRIVTPAEAQPALEVPPNRLGYAFEQPEILIRQRLFGLAHGISLLAAACLDLPAHSKPIQDAYAAWHAKQGKAIETIVRDLAQYYFGQRASEARWPDLSRALNLGDSIQPALNELTLHAACASLPEAIARPRYELDRMLVEGIEPAAKVETAAGPPAEVPAAQREGMPDAPATSVQKAAE